jgi:superoxide dismutase, Cu-Zn family
MTQGQLQLLSVISHSGEMRRSSRLALAALAGALALSGCGGTTALTSTPPPAATHTTNVSATFETVPDPAITYDPALVPAGAHGAVSSTSAGGSTTVMLAVRGLQPNRHYGAHAHAKPCGAKGADAGPHFQKDVDPVQPSVDPAFANAQNEIWLDFTTDQTGAGSARTTVAWEFPADRRAHSVIVHAMPTATEPGKAGTAGDRAACITVDF